MTEPGPALTARQRALVALSDELAPAKSLVRLDAATGRVVTTVSVIGTLLTGFGLLTLPGVDGAPRALAVVSVALALIAVMAALCAQVVTITRGLNPNNLVEVESWYRRRFEARAPLVRAASLLLVGAVGVAGVAGLLAVVRGNPDRAALAVTRTSVEAEPSASGSASPEVTDTVVADVTFRGLTSGQTATVTVSVGGRVTAEAVVTAAQDGTAARTITVEDVPATARVEVDARGGGARCTADGRPGQPLRLSCSAD